MKVQVNLIGRLGKDAEVKTSSNGKQYVSFTVALNEVNNGTEETTWFDVKGFDDQFIKIAQYLTKGKLVHINGSEQVRLYNDNSGNPRIGRSVILSMLEFISVGNSQQKQDSSETITCGTLNPPQQQQVQVSVSTSSSNDDDLPF